MAPAAPDARQGRHRAAAATVAQYAQSRFNQAHIDAYYASHGAHQRLAVRAFLIWATGHGHIPRDLHIPRQDPSSEQAITRSAASTCCTASRPHR